MVTASPTPVLSVLGRARARLKAFGYSGPARERWQHPEHVIAALRPQEGDRVADIGAGGGYFTFRLADAVGPTGLVYAVDPDPDMNFVIGRKAARTGVDNVVTVKAPTDGPGLPEAVDLIVIVDALHHLPDAHAYVREVARYLRPGGRLAVIEPVPRKLLFGHATDPDEIRSMVTSAGYTLLAEHEFLPRQSFQVFQRP